MKLKLLVIAIVIAGGAGNAVTLAANCAHQPGDDGAWSWRMIDAQKCWYRGRKVLAKDQLHWSSSDHPNTQAVRTSWLERVSDKAPPAEIYFPTIVKTNANILESYPLLMPQPWLKPDTIMFWPLLIDIDRTPFTTWTKRIGP